MKVALPDLQRSAVVGPFFALEPAVRLQLGEAFFAQAIAAMREAKDGALVVGLCGPQGSGKSTMARRLENRLGHSGYRIAACSLDDFYLARSERLELAARVHPLLATRGVPGTHDIGLLGETLSALSRADEAAVTPLPVFDKALDDRLPHSEWREHRGSADIVLLEGWCVGARPQAGAALAEPINCLERDEDVSGLWRQFVNTQLSDGYAAIFARLDFNLMLRAPSFDCVYGWRAEQEAGLTRRRQGAIPPMDAKALAHFVAHYERLTRWLMQDEPAHLVADLLADRSPTGWRTPHAAN